MTKEKIGAVSTANALKMAIKDLENIKKWWCGVEHYQNTINACKEALRAESEALEQQEAAEQAPCGQPVAWLSTNCKANEIIKTHPTKQQEQEPAMWDEEEFNRIAYSYRSWLAHDIKGVNDRYQELVNYVLNLIHPVKQLSDDEILERAAQIVVERYYKD